MSKHPPYKLFRTYFLCRQIQLKRCSAFDAKSQHMSGIRYISRVGYWSVWGWIKTKKCRIVDWCVDMHWFRTTPEWQKNPKARKKLHFTIIAEAIKISLFSKLKRVHNDKIIFFQKKIFCFFQKTILKSRRKENIMSRAGPLQGL